MEPISGNVFAAECIMRERRRKGKTEYLVKWKGWNSRHNSWEPTENILDARLLQEFAERQERVKERRRGSGKRKGKSSSSDASKKKILKPTSSDEEDAAEGQSSPSETPEPSTSQSNVDREDSHVDAEEKDDDEVAGEEEQAQAEPSDNARDAHADNDSDSAAREEKGDSLPPQPSPSCLGQTDDPGDHSTGLPWSRVDDVDDEPPAESSTEPTRSSANVGDFQYNNSCTLTDVEVKKTTVTFVEL